MLFDGVDFHRYENAISVSSDMNPSTCSWDEASCVTIKSPREGMRHMNKWHLTLKIRSRLYERV